MRWVCGPATTHEAIGRGSIGRMRECVPLHDVNVFWCPGPLFHIAAMQTMLGAIGLTATYVTDTHFDPPVRYGRSPRIGSRRCGRGFSRS